MSQTKRSWVLRHRPQGAIRIGDLELVTSPIPPLEPGQILIRNIYLSLDPANRVWMDDVKQYMEPVRVGDVMLGGVIGVVEASNSELHRPGTLVSLLGRWETHSVVPAEAASSVHQIPGLPLIAFMSVLGGASLAAYFGMTDVARPNPGETVVVSSAAGAVGSIAGQIAKIAGARVIGIAGSAEKCAWLTDELSFDGAINYKSEDVGAALDRLCPNGIDVDFENVGGTIMKSVIDRMKDHGRMALCGMISSYNDAGLPSGPANFSQVLYRRIAIKPFITTDYIPRAGEAFAQLAQWVATGELKWKAHVVPGLENAVDAFGLLFKGGHFGKLIVQISPEP